MNVSFDEPDNDRGKLSAALWRRKWLVTLFVLSGLVVSGFVALSTPRKYTAEVIVEVKPNYPQPINLNPVVSRLLPDIVTVRTESERLASEGFVRSLFGPLQAMSDPELLNRESGNLTDDGGQTPDSFPERLRHFCLDLRQKGYQAVRAALQSLNVVHLPKPVNEAQVFAAFKRRYGAEYLPNTFAVAIHYTSESARRAAYVVNTAASMYVASQAQERLKATEAAVAALRDKTASLRIVMQRSSNALEAYRMKEKLYQVDNVGRGLLTLAPDTLAKLNEQVTKAQADEADLRARVNVVGPVSQERLQTAREKVRLLKALLNDAYGQAAVEAKAQVGLRDLEQQARADEDIYNKFLLRLTEAEQQQSFVQPDSAVLSRAEIPAQPTSPNILLLIAGGTAAAGSAGMLLGLLLEKNKTGFATPLELARFSGLPVLGIAPAVRHRGRLLSGRTAQSSFRDIRTSLLLDHHTRSSGRVILITSCVPGEGKTTLAANLAVQIGLAGHRCLLLDADLRNSQLSRKLHSSTSPGVAEVISGHCTNEAAVQTAPGLGISYLTAGRPADDPGAVLQSAAMRKLVSFAAEHFDYVLIDAPPMAVGNDAMVLAGLAHEVIFAVRWSRTGRSAVSAALKNLQKMNADLKLVLTRVKPSQLPKYMGSGIYGFGHNQPYQALLGDG